MQKNILIIEQDKQICSMLCEQINDNNQWITQSANSIENAQTILKLNQHDLIILGNIKQQNQYKILNSQNIKSPILTILDNANQTQITHNDNTIYKPMRLKTLKQRINKLLSMQHNYKDSLCQIGNYQFSPSEATLSEINNPKITIKLTDKENKLLNTLCQNKGENISKNKLLEQVWGYKSNTNTHTIETYIYRLRQKIENNTKTKIIISEKGGYRINDNA